MAVVVSQMHVQAAVDILHAQITRLEATLTHQMQGFDARLAMIESAVLQKHAEEPRGPHVAP